MNYDSSPEVNQGFAYGLRQSLTIVIGYAPVAVTFGILATQFGLTFWEAGLMSYNPQSLFMGRGLNVPFCQTCAESFSGNHLWDECVLGIG